MSSLALDADAVSARLGERAADGRSIRQVFLVACGGSLVDLYPGGFLLTRESQDLRTSSFTANEFVHATPKALSEDSVVVVCTHSGGTAEAVEATRIAQSKGAFTILLTHNAEAKAAAYADHTIVYDWGDDSRVSDNPLAIALSVCAEILQYAEGYPAYEDFRAALTRIDSIVTAACEKAREPAAAFADKNRDEGIFYVLSSGATFGHAHGFAACSLMEMQWLNASAIHSGEYFHGPFEITDETTNFIVLVNEGSTRPLDERVIRFLEQYAKRYELVDARELGIDELPASVVDYFNPVLFYSVMCVYREALATVRNHPLERRRYMGKVEY